MHARNAALALLASLAGCASPPEPAAGLATLQAVYCYRTLADIDCHTVREFGQDGRLVGVYLRTPPPDGLPMWPMPPLP